MSSKDQPPHIPLEMLLQLDDSHEIDELEYEASDEEEEEDEEEVEEENLEPPIKVECECGDVCPCDYDCGEEIIELPEVEEEEEEEEEDEDEEAAEEEEEEEMDIEEEEEPEIEFEPEVEVVVQDIQPIYLDDDDDDSFFVWAGDDDKKKDDGNLIIDDTENEVDEVLDIFEEAPKEEEPIDTLTEIEGVVGITLSEKTKQYFGIENLTIESSPKYVWLNWKKIRLHIFTFEAESEFTAHYDKIKYYPDLAMLLGVDVIKQTGHEYYLCLTMGSRNRILNPPKKRQAIIDAKKKEDLFDELASIEPRKWRGFMSELEVDQENVVQSRPPITITVHRLRTFFGDGEDVKFQNTDIEDPNMTASFDPIDSSANPYIHMLEIDRGIQVKEVTTSSSTQIGPSFKRNKMVQHSTQSVSDENTDVLMKSKSMANFFKATLPRLEKVLQQNEMADLLFNDYKNLKVKKEPGLEGVDMEAMEAALLQEYQTYSDNRTSKARTVKWMPSLTLAALQTLSVTALPTLSTLPPIEEQPMTGEEEIRAQRIAAVHDAWVQSKVMKSQEQQEQEEIEQEERLNREYIEFLNFQAEVVEELKQNEPTLPTEEVNFVNEYDAIIMEAQRKQNQEDAILLAEEEEEEEAEEGEGEPTEVKPNSAEKK